MQWIYVEERPGSVLGEQDRSLVRDHFVPRTVAVISFGLAGTQAAAICSQGLPPVRPLPPLCLTGTWLPVLMAGPRFPLRAPPSSSLSVSEAAPALLFGNRWFFSIRECQLRVGSASFIRDLRPQVLSRPRWIFAAFGSPLLFLAVFP